LFVKNGHGAEYKSKVKFTDDIDEIVSFLAGQKDQGQKMMGRLESLGMSQMLSID
jgi:hypothetical protein